MAETAARVTRLLTATKPTTIATALGAIPSDVADPTTLVALLATGRSTGTVTLGRACLAFTRDVAHTTTAVARLLLRCYSAFAA